MTKTSLLFSLLFAACTATDNNANPTNKGDVQNIADVSKTDETTIEECADDGFAEVTQVTTSGSAGNIQFSVTLKSPDTGCSQYANWWEVLDENGKLVYRRILGHSHVDEQPFTRSGGPADVEEDAILIVRAHMNPAGYGTKVFKGSVRDGFSRFDTECGFASDPATEEPLPTNCAF